MTESLKPVDSDNFYAEVTNSKIPVLVKFSAEWCGPCKVMKPLVEKFAKEHPEYKICEVDVDTASDVAKTYSIRSIPAFISFKDGEAKKFHAGTLNEAKILELLDFSDVIGE